MTVRLHHSNEIVTRGDILLSTSAGSGLNTIRCQ